MVKIGLKISCITAILLIFYKLGISQDIHFSQYFNTPMLQNAANTALMSDRDFRATGAYRTQWANIPAPFTTFHAASEFQVNRNDQFSNWLGIGLYALTDKAGDGDLSMTSFGLNAAYHLMTSESSIFSFGMGAAYANRGINFSKLSFDTQWDGFTFNKELPNGEVRMYEQAKYLNVSAGMNFSYFPNENLYMKIGIGMSHINRPKVSLLGNSSNVIGFRPMMTADAIIAFQNGWTVRPSIYGTYMEKASNLIFGSSVSKSFQNSGQDLSGNVYAGIYHRLNESIIGLIGIEWNDVKFTASYDFTVSGLSYANNGNGAFELTLIFQGFYGGRSGLKGGTPWECPRF